MVIEMTRRPGLFENSPAWLEIAVTSILIGILALVLELVGIFPRSLTLPFAVFMVPVTAVTTLRRRKYIPTARSAAITQDQAARTIATINDGRSNSAMKQAVKDLQGEGLKKTEAELVVIHFLRQVSPERFGPMNGFFETRVRDA